MVLKRALQTQYLEVMWLPWKIDREERGLWSLFCFNAAVVWPKPTWSPHQLRAKGYFASAPPRSFHSSGWGGRTAELSCQHSKIPRFCWWKSFSWVSYHAAKWSFRFWGTFVEQIVSTSTKHAPLHPTPARCWCSLTTPQPLCWVQPLRPGKCPRGNPPNSHQQPWQPMATHKSWVSAVVTRRTSA